MPLVACKECGAQISTSAVSCPTCGYPVKAKRATKGCLGLLLAVVGLGVLGTVIGALENQTTPVAGSSAHDGDLVPKPLIGDNLTQESWQTKVVAPACRSQDYFDKLENFAAAKDQDAYRTQLNRGLVAAECRLLPKSQKVFIESGGLFSSKCVRIRGETECWYTSQSLLEPAQ